ncbi:putative 6'-deoxychalcone synthase [Medicago truncatula]|uniref:Aldo/keto reductase family oxidoreductase n=2 Tax=Medicago truncatula TaxID=3880 RepID=A0A072TEP5_MEDTR|nr:NAD(P)H-dependent 6'-deoxychalcone synthase [Medicago truncatula]KEH16024.1 aldo/keto reductase family oxidoreductase [Medicago truncatula]RHN79125.1 putative 6'-deoxychalcone synthase [Medicago truncatula]
MSASKIPQVVLKSSSNQSNMPVIAFGTAAVTNNDGEITKVAVIEAIKSGYRHFDTASIYGSEEALGEAIEEALQLGLIGSRDELFITSKLWVTDNFPHLVLPALQKSLQTLKLEYLDLYLIHWPISVKPGNWELPYAEELITTFDLKGVWTSMEECQKLGLTKYIGVSNFTRKKLEDLLSFAIIPPSVNQVEMNPVWHQKKLKEYCEAKGIIITAFSPLGAKGASWGSNEVMDSEILKQIAEEHGKNIAQVCLRWLYEQGVTMAVKSYNKERMKQNMEIFDWSLAKDDHEKIDQIKQIRVNNGPVVFIPNLWDGET